MSELKLRDYQRECIDAVFAAWSEGVKRPAVVLPTGLGKTVVFSALAKRFRQDWIGGGMGSAAEQAPGQRVIVLVHRDELADQAIGKLRATLPKDVRVGKVKAEDNDIDADVMVCSVQTLSIRRRTSLMKLEEYVTGPIGLIITDECHHAAAASYKKIYAAFPNALQVGFTATLARGDNQGLGDVWDDVVYTKSVLWGISKGFLADVRAQRVETSFDLAGVKTSRGDWQAGDLGLAMEEAHADKAIATAYVEHAKDRPGVVFTPTVDTAHATAEALNAAGVPTAVITGETSREERQDIFRRYREGGVQVLANCMVLTEGFDAPWASCAVIARPTQSNPLYIQMVGRVLRPWPGKRDALVLDVVGASASNKLCTLVDLEPAFVAEVRDGETLAEAAERETEAAAAAGQPVPGTVAFDLKSRAVDLFAGSKAAWSMTPKGVMFIDAGEVTVFLWPDRKGLWHVLTKPTKSGAGWERTEYGELDLGMALAWGEAVAEDNYAGFSVGKQAPWRRKPASDAQRVKAKRYGIDVRGKNAGAVSDAIGVALASRVLDKHVGRVYA